MARAFTINFSYNGSTYLAVISQINESVTIYIPDETLHGIIPQGKFWFDAEKIKFDTPQLKWVQDLIVTVYAVIEEQDDVFEKRKFQ